MPIGESKRTKTEPEVGTHSRAQASVALEIGTPLTSALAAANWIPTLETRLASELNLLIATLGLKQKPQVSVQSVVSQRALRLRINGAIHAYDPELMKRVWTAVAPADQRQIPYAQAGTGSSSFPDSWLAAHIESAGMSESKLTGIIAEFIARLVTEVIAERPSSLVTEEEGEAYVEDVRAKSFSSEMIVSAKDMTQVIKSVLDLGITLVDRSAFANTLALAQQHDLSVEDTIESVFTQFRSQRIEIHVHPEYIKSVLNLTAIPVDSNNGSSAVGPVRQLLNSLLGRLTQSRSTTEALAVYSEHVSANVQGLFRVMEEQVFLACGLHLPDIVLVGSRQMQEGFVSIKINGWLSAPILALQAGEVFINELPELSPGLAESATPAVDPRNGKPGCILKENQTAAQVEGQGLRTGPLEFLTFILYRELLTNAHRLFGVEDTEYQLALLKPSCERLIQVASSRFSIADITRVIRRLLLEGLSFRNTWVILEKLLQFDTVPVDSINQSTLDDRLEVMTQNGNTQISKSAAYQEFVRAAYKNYMSHKYRQGSGQVTALFLVGAEQLATFTSDPSQLEGDLDESAVEQFKDALWTEIGKIRSRNRAPILITAPLLRRRVRDLIAPELRGLPVTAYNEILLEQTSEIAMIPFHNASDSDPNKRTSAAVESS